MQYKMDESFLLKLTEAMYTLNKSSHESIFTEGCVKVNDVLYFKMLEDGKWCLVVETPEVAPNPTGPDKDGDTTVGKWHEDFDHQ